MRVIKYTPDTVYNSGTNGYGAHMSFKLENNKGALAQLFVKCDVAASGGDVSGGTYKSMFRILKYAKLYNQSSTIARQTPNYAIARRTLISSSSLAEQIDNSGISVLNNVVGLTGTMYIPFFAFFSDNKKEPLPLNGLSQLFFEIQTADNNAALGITGTMVLSNFELFAYYNQIMDIPMAIKNSYDMFREPVVSLNAVSSTRVVLTCPYPVFTVHLHAVDNNFTDAKIKTIKLTNKNEVLFETNRRMYYLLSSETDYDPTTTINIDFGSRQRDYYKKFTQENAPVILDITYDAATTGNLYIICEYWSNLKIENNNIIEDVSGLFQSLAV